MIDDDNDITKYKTDIPILCVSNLLWVLTSSWVLIKQKAVKQHNVIFVALDFLMIGFQRSNLMEWSKEQKWKHIWTLSTKAMEENKSMSLLS